MAAQPGEITLHKYPIGPYDNNCYLLEDPATGVVVVVDAPPQAERVLEALAGRSVALLVITHQHADHIASVELFRQRLGCPVAVHPADAGPVPGPTVPLEQGQMLPLGRFQLQVIHTPGHTPGSLCLLAGGHLISGDTLFPNGPGHTRRPQDLRTIIRSITERLFVLPDELAVHPGHGADTSLGVEKGRYAQFAALEHSDDLCGDVLWVPTLS